MANELIRRAGILTNRNPEDSNQNGKNLNDLEFFEHEALNKDNFKATTFKDRNSFGAIFGGVFMVMAMVGVSIFLCLSGLMKEINHIFLIPILGAVAFSFLPTGCYIGFHVSKLLPKGLFEDLDAKCDVSIESLRYSLDAIVLTIICGIFWFVAMAEFNPFTASLVAIVTLLWLLAVGFCIYSVLNNQD